MEILQKTGALQVIVTGENCNEQRLEKIKQDGFLVDAKVECLMVEDTYLDLGHTIARGIKNFSDVFSDMAPDILVVLGDRYEIFAAAPAAYSLKIPIAHIHGGEVTYGALDEGYRHAISKFSQLHFVSHEDYRRRLMRMGENPKNIYTVGAPGLDYLSTVDFSDTASCEWVKEKDYFLVTLHSTTLGRENPEEQSNCLIEALEAFPEYRVIVTQSNPDPGGKLLNKRWQTWAESNPNVIFVPILGDDYLKVAYFSKMVIGNSSSGILEIPYLDRPCLNIGVREEGRIIPKGVYGCSFDTQSIKESIQDILENYQGSSKIYGIPGNISQSIADILSETSFENLMYKRFYDATA
jgi:UDP-hydrolysing UDP-N-acetyl-D-glucosamine 2-epimerase